MILVGERHSHEHPLIDSLARPRHDRRTVTSDRIQKRIESLLDEADSAASEKDWVIVRDKADQALAFDPENSDAKGYLEAALRRIPGEDAQPSARSRG